MYGAGNVARYRNSLAFTYILDAVLSRSLGDHPECTVDNAGRYFHPGFNVFHKHAISRACETRPRYRKSRVLRNEMLGW